MLKSSPAPADSQITLSRKKSDCRSYPIRQQRTRGRFRCLSVSVDEDMRQQAKALQDTEPFQQPRRLRKKVEMLFTHRKQQFRLRGSPVEACSPSRARVTHGRQCKPLLPVIHHCDHGSERADEPDYGIGEMPRVCGRERCHYIKGSNAREALSLAFICRERTPGAEINSRSGHVPSGRPGRLSRLLNL